MFLFVFLCRGSVPILRAADVDTAALDKIVGEAVQAFEVPVAAVAVVQNDRVTYVKGFGVRRLGASEEVTPDTVFALASCTKAFTATGVALLVAEKKMNWDDPVRKHLDFFRLSDALADREVTIRDLLCHRTGMPRHDWLRLPLGDPDVESSIRAYGRAKPSTSFRSTWEYANIPFFAAGFAVGRVDGSDWQTVICRRLFEPLQMANACCTAHEAEANPNHAVPHFRGLAGRIEPVVFGQRVRAYGSGSIHASARDMANWLRFQLAEGVFDGKRLLPADILRETRTAQIVVRREGSVVAHFTPETTRHLAYGLGWFVHDYRGHLVISHGGSGSGFRAETAFIPDAHCGVVVFGNLYPSRFPEALSKTLLDHLLGLPPKDWNDFYRKQEAKQEDDIKKQRKKRAAERKPDTKPSLDLAAYAGSYEEPAYGKADVQQDKDALIVRLGGMTFRLEHYHFDTFTAVLTAPDARYAARMNLQAHFRLGTNGEVEGMRFLDQDFKRVRPVAK
jgi:CubicO group peptidase (beta-lactamase class C family)